MADRRESGGSKFSYGGGGGPNQTSNNNDTSNNNTTNLRGLNNESSGSFIYHPQRGTGGGQSSSSKDVLVGGQLNRDDNIVARLDGLSRVMNENNSLLVQLVKKMSEQQQQQQQFQQQQLAFQTSLLQQQHHHQHRNNTSAKLTKGGGGALAAGTDSAGSPIMTGTAGSSSAFTADAYSGLYDRTSVEAALNSSMSNLPGRARPRRIVLPENGSPTTTSSMSPTAGALTRRDSSHKQQHQYQRKGSTTTGGSASSPTSAGWNKVRRALMAKIRQDKATTSDAAGIAVTSNIGSGVPNASELMNMNAVPSFENEQKRAAAGGDPVSSTNHNPLAGMKQQNEDGDRFDEADDVIMVDDDDGDDLNNTLTRRPQNQQQQQQSSSPSSPSLSAKFDENGQKIRASMRRKKITPIRRQTTGVTIPDVRTEDSEEEPDEHNSKDNSSDVEDAASHRKQQSSSSSMPRKDSLSQTRRKTIQMEIPTFQLDGEGNADFFGNSKTTAMSPSFKKSEEEDDTTTGMQQEDESSMFYSSSSSPLPKNRKVIRKLEGETSPGSTAAAASIFDFTIDPESWIAFWLDFIFICSGFGLCIIFVTFLLLPTTSLNYNHAVAASAVFQVLTIIWVASRFFMQSRGKSDESPFAQYTEDQEWEICDTPETIRSKYLSFWFYFDLFYAFPIEFCFVFEEKWFFYVMTRHILRYVRISTIGKSANPLVDDRGSALVLVAYASVTGILLHLTGTLFIYFENEDGKAQYNFLSGLHWSVQLFSAVGATSFPLTSQATEVLSIFASIAGVAVVAVSAGLCASLLTQKDILAEEQSKAKKMMHSMLRHFSIPWNLQKEIILLFPAVLKAQSESQFRDMIRVLPQFLGEQVEGYLRAKMLAKVPLFAGLDDEIILKLSRTLEQVFAAPFEYIIHAGESGSEMFLLTHGVVEVLIPINDEEECPIATLRSGSHFGEIALIEDSVRTASVQAISACDLLILDKAVFKDVVAQHVELQERIQKEIHTRREEIEKKQKASEKHNRKRSMRIHNPASIMPDSKNRTGDNSIQEKSSSAEHDDDSSSSHQQSDNDDSARERDHNHRRHERALVKIQSGEHNNNNNDEDENHHHHHSPMNKEKNHQNQSPAADALYNSVVRMQHQHGGNILKPIRQGPQKSNGNNHSVTSNNSNQWNSTTSEVDIITGNNSASTVKASNSDDVGAGGSLPVLQSLDSMETSINPSNTAIHSSFRRNKQLQLQQQQQQNNTNSDGTVGGGNNNNLLVATSQAQQQMSSRPVSPMMMNQPPGGNGSFPAMSSPNNNNNNMGATPMSSQQQHQQTPNSNAMQTGGALSVFASGYNKGGGASRPVSPMMFK